jgi:hypothetical protein
MIKLKKYKCHALDVYKADDVSSLLAELNNRRVEEIRQYEGRLINLNKQIEVLKRKKQRWIN